MIKTLYLHSHPDLLLMPGLLPLNKGCLSLLHHSYDLMQLLNLLPQLILILLPVPLLSLVPLRHLLSQGVALRALLLEDPAAVV